MSYSCAESVDHAPWSPVHCWSTTLVELSVVMSFQHHRGSTVRSACLFEGTGHWYATTVNTQQANVYVCMYSLSQKLLHLLFEDSPQILNRV